MAWVCYLHKAVLLCVTGRWLNHPLMATRPTQLGLWQRAIFLDWHGVLSREPFWGSIRGSATHPLSVPLEQEFASVLRDVLMLNWMRGQESAETVVSRLSIRLDNRYRDDFLLRRLREDCRRMRGDPAVAEALRVFNASAMVVVATDNADCFAEAFERSRNAGARRRDGVANLSEWARITDGLLCSSALGTLKAESPSGFFGPWLRRHGMTFADAVLVDDREDNCEAFEGSGGHAIRWRLGTDSVGSLVGALRSWLTSTPKTGRPGLVA